MNKCPVCQRQNQGYQCDQCGFDGSRNYEALPTVSKVSGKTISAYKLEFAAGQACTYSDSAVNSSPKEKKKRWWVIPVATAAVAAACAIVFLSGKPSGADNAEPVHKHIWAQTKFTDVKRCSVCEALDLPMPMATQTIDTYDHTLGLKSNGTVLAEGPDFYNKCSSVITWTAIVSVGGGTDHAVGLKSNGTLVAVGKNEYGQCDISTWERIRLPKQG